MKNSKLEENTLLLLVTNDLLQKQWKNQTQISKSCFILRYFLYNDILFKKNFWQSLLNLKSRIV